MVCCIGCLLLNVKGTFFGMSEFRNGDLTLAITRPSSQRIRSNIFDGAIYLIDSFVVGFNI
jgi:hypothetical protein